MPADLDDPAQVERLDSSNMMGAVDRFPEDLLEQNRSQRSMKIESRDSRASNLVFMGMGGSASAADVLLDWLRNKIRIPAIVHRDASLPRFVGPQTLFVAISYSGETAETLAGFRLAKRRGSELIGIGTGGRLASVCRSFNVPFVEVASTVAPRAAIGKLIVAGANVLESLELVNGTRPELVNTSKELVRLRKHVGAGNTSLKNPAKRLAARLYGHFVSVYSLQRMSSVARRFKNQLAENSKVLAKYDVLPESGHNEIEAWHRPSTSLLPIIIRDWKESSFESSVLRRFSSTVAYASHVRPLEVRLKAQGQLSRLLSPIFFLDYVSVYLAMLRHIDPTPTPLIGKYKGKMNLVIS